MKNERLDRLIAEQSSEWIGALNRGNGENNPAFAEWLLDSKRHVRVFLLASALDRELEHFDPERRHAVPPLQKAGAEIIPLDETLADTSELPPLTEDAPCGTSGVDACASQAEAPVGDLRCVVGCSGLPGGTRRADCAEPILGFLQWLEAVLHRRRRTACHRTTGWFHSATEHAVAHRCEIIRAHKRHSSDQRRGDLQSAP